MDRAEDLVREMEEEGIDASIDIYHTMMDGYTNISDEEKCIIVFKRLEVCILLINSHDKFLGSVSSFLPFLFVRKCDNKILMVLITNICAINCGLPFLSFFFLLLLTIK